MASLLNISIPPLTEGQRIEDWKPIFIAATSALVANSSQKVGIQFDMELLNGQEEFG